MLGILCGLSVSKRCFRGKIEEKKMTKTLLTETVLGNFCWFAMHSMLQVEKEPNLLWNAVFPTLVRTLLSVSRQTRF